MIKIRQEESGIVEMVRTQFVASDGPQLEQRYPNPNDILTLTLQLEQRYPIQKPGSALAPKVASTGGEPEHFRMAEPVVTSC